MTTIEAMKLALDALEIQIGEDKQTSNSYEAKRQAIVALRQTIEREEALNELTQLSQELGGYDA